MTAAVSRRIDLRDRLPEVFLVAVLIPITIFLIVQVAKEPTVWFETTMNY